MMNNLFSSFDPSSTKTMSLNWLSMWMPMILLPSMFWILPSQTNIVFMKTINMIQLEMNLMMKSKEIKSSLMFLSLFSMIFMMNLMSMFPFMFTPTSHLCISLSLSLPLWMNLIIFALINKTKKFLAHLIPFKSPLLISPLMVLIESISTIIRPITLSLRLSINLMTGHLIPHIMLSIKSNMLMSKTMMFLVFMIILVLEFLMTFIQAYVFAMLGTMYSSEIH